MPHLVAARMVGTAGGAMRESASAAAVEFASWCSRRSAEPPSSSASEGLLPSQAAPARDPPVQQASSPDVTVPVAFALLYAYITVTCFDLVCVMIYDDHIYPAKTEPDQANSFLNRRAR